jgi:hypothetical protein
MFGAQVAEKSYETDAKRNHSGEFTPFCLIISKQTKFKF